MRVCAVNGTSVAPTSSRSQAVALLGQHDDRAAFGRLVGQARELRGVGQLLLGDAVDRQERVGLAVAERDRAGLVEQQRGAVAGRLDGAAAHRQHVALHEAVHAGDADRREQPADGRGDEAHQQRDEDDDVCSALANIANGCSVTVASRKMMVRPASRMLSAISLGVFCRSAPSTSAIMRSRNVSPGSGGDAHDDLVREHPGAAGDRRAVTARLADDRRRLTGDRRLVDAGDALDDLAVAGDDLAGGDDALVADVERGARPLLDRPVGPPAARHRLRPGLAQRVGLRLAAALGDRLGEVREQHREPQEHGDEPGEDVLVVDDEPRSLKNRIVVRTLPTPTTNMTGLRISVRGFSLTKLSTTARRTIAGSNSGRADVVEPATASLLLRA